MPFVAGESGWVTEGRGVGVGPLQPQAGDLTTTLRCVAFSALISVACLLALSYMGPKLPDSR